VWVFTVSKELLPHGVDQMIKMGEQKFVYLEHELEDL